MCNVCVHGVCLYMYMYKCIHGVCMCICMYMYMYYMYKCTIVYIHEDIREPQLPRLRTAFKA